MGAACQHVSVVELRVRGAWRDEVLARGRLAAGDSGRDL